MANNNDIVFQKKRKMYLMMPLVVVPMLSLLFFILGGGKADAETTRLANANNEIEFPQDNRQSVPTSKMDAFLAKEDEQRRFGNEFMDLTTGNDTEDSSNQDANFANGLPKDSNLIKMQQEYLNNYKNGLNIDSINAKAAAVVASTAAAKKQANQQMNEERGGEPKSLFNSSSGGDNNNKRKNEKMVSTHMTKAIFHGTQKMRTNEVVKIRILEPIEIEDLILPANTIVNGITGTGGGSNRVLIKIHNVVLNGVDYGVKWSVFDRDGNEGVYVPNSGIQDGQVNGQGGVQGLNEVESSTRDIVEQVSPIAGAATSIVAGVTKTKVSRRSNNFHVTFYSGNEILINVDKERK
jgi:hypothetical protein